MLNIESSADNIFIDASNSEVKPGKLNCLFTETDLMITIMIDVIVNGQ